MKTAFRIITIASPSGAGKTTLYKKLLAEFPELRFSVSTTTRAPRSKESDGVDYHFVDRETFLAMVDRGDFVEWEEVHGKHYGTTHAEIRASRDQERSIFLDLDYRGALSIKKAYPETVSIFLLPPTMTELERRIRSRGENTEEQIALRMKNAASELEHFHKFDYIIINDVIDRAYDELRAIYVAAGCRREGRENIGRALIEEAKGNDATNS